jgi:hypothetical protein
VAIGHAQESLVKELTTTLSVSHLPNLTLAVTLSRIAAHEALTVIRNGVSHQLSSGHCPVVHCSKPFLQASRATRSLETMGMTVTRDGSDSRLGIILTRCGGDVVGAVLDLGRLAQIGLVDRALRDGSLPLLLSADGGAQARVVMPVVTGALRDALVAGLGARVMTPLEFVDTAAGAIRGLVRPGAGPARDLGLQELRSLSMSVCLDDGHLSADDVEPFAPGTVH